MTLPDGEATSCPVLSMMTALPRVPIRSEARNRDSASSEISTP
jgi:hypothetical protein